MKKFFAMLMAVCLILGLMSVPFAAPTDRPHVSSEVEDFGIWAYAMVNNYDSLAEYKAELAKFGGHPSLSRTYEKYGEEYGNQLANALNYYYDTLDYQGYRIISDLLGGEFGEPLTDDLRDEYPFAFSYTPVSPRPVRTLNDVEVWFPGATEPIRPKNVTSDSSSSPNASSKPSEAPSTPSFAPADGIAYPSTQTVDVDGKKVVFQCYALKDANGYDTNYIKLRDLALILSGSGTPFNVGWNGNVTIATKEAYVPNGSEQNTPFSGQREYRIADAKTVVDGKDVAMDAFVLTDDNGGGYTYYKLRDLGTAIGFHVDWSGERGIFIETMQSLSKR